MLKRLWQERVQVALVENRRNALDRFQFHAPLARGTLPRVERKALRQQRLADVVEPSVVTLQGWAFKARFPEHNITAGMVANSAVVVGEGDAGAGAGHWHPGQRVALRVGALASCRDIWKTPTSVALAPHID